MLSSLTKRSERSMTVTGLLVLTRAMVEASAREVPRNSTSLVLATASLSWTPMIYLSNSSKASMTMMTSLVVAFSVGGRKAKPKGIRKRNRPSAAFSMMTMISSEVGLEVASGVALEEVALVISGWAVAQATLVQALPQVGWVLLKQ